MLIILLVAVFAVTLIFGVPIAFCLGLAGLAFIVLSGVVPIAVPPTLMFAGMDSFPLLAIPFFVIAGDLMQRCGILPSSFTSPTAWWDTCAGASLSSSSSPACSSPG